VASWLAPADLRTEWSEQWNAEIWHGYASLKGRGASRAEARHKLLRFSVGAFSDAVDLRRSVFNLRAGLGHPAFCLALPLVLLAILFAATHGFRNCREMIAGLPYPLPQQLMLVSQSVRVLGFEAPPSAADLLAWQRQSSRASLAGFVVQGRVLRVTPNFNDVLGVAPRTPFRLLGQTIETIKPLDRKRGRVGVLARLKSPAFPAEVEAELVQVSSPRGSAVAVKSLQGRLREPLVFSAVVWALTLVVGMALVRGRWRGALFFFAKTTLAQGALAAAWTELAARLTTPPTGGSSVTGAFLLPGLLLMGAALALRWSLYDQKGRCPVCFQLLAMPVRIGSRSSIILDRPGVEVLCPRGHGSLLIPEPVVHAAEPAAWTVFNESWKDCFTPGGGSR
jgi:hypothetical protein